MELKGVLCALAFLYFCVSSHGRIVDVRVMFQKVPSPVTSQKSATFAFEVSRGDDGDTCTDCSILCKLDDEIPMDCKRKEVSYLQLKDGEHKFGVCINGSNKTSCSSYHWTIDTVHPTASISTATSFTNATSISVAITFNKPCLSGGRGFHCSSVNSCNLLVYGPGQVIPSTFAILRSDLKFSIVVSLSSAIQYGRVILAMQKGFCTDSAGKRFIRTANSTYRLHFDRRTVSANLTAHVSTKLLQLNSEPRIVEATNNNRNLRVYVQFTVPVLNSSSEILSALHPSSGFLVPLHGKTLGNRRFSFRVNNISTTAVVTITMQNYAIVSRQGTFVSSIEPLIFLYDSQRPRVRLTTTSERRTRDDNLPVLIKFVEPVFDFNESAVSISGGRLLRFTKMSWSLYSVVVSPNGSLVSVMIPENVTQDVAGNNNLASNLLQVIHYSIPTFSVLLSTVSTVAFAATALVAGLLTISTSSLQYFGALSKPSPQYLNYDPSRNLIRTACHIQMIALSRWLPVTLPIEYYEFVRGLQWSIPHLKLPWENDQLNSVTDNLGSHLHTLVQRVEQRVVENTLNIHEANNTLGTVGIANKLSAMEYASIFEKRNMIPEAQAFFNARINTGWNEFKRNMFWLSVTGGSLILLHALILFALKLKRRNLEVKRPTYGALVFPRFELFLIILALPCVCQAAAAVIKGGSTAGIIVGILMIGLSSLCALSLLSFLTVGIAMGKLLQYKEVHNVGETFHWYQELVRIILGPGKRGQWTWKEQTCSVRNAMFGPLFEDLRGPPRYVVSQIVGGNSQKNDTRIIDSDNETEDAKASFTQKIFGILRIYYTMLEIIKRITFGIIAGAYSGCDAPYKFPVVVIFSVTAFQLSFMVLEKPFIRKRVQFVEVISIISEAGILLACIALLGRDFKVADDKTIGISMIIMFFVGFILQIINEWHSLINQVLRLSPNSQSFTRGLKVFFRGLLLILIPREFLDKCGSHFSENLESNENAVTLQNQLDISGFVETGRRTERESGSSSKLDRPWRKQLREMAKASFSREEETNAELDPSSSGNPTSLGRTPSPTGLYKDLQAIFSSATR